jgi:hypothetical protein
MTQLISLCVDSALSEADFVVKPTFYKLLEECYGIKAQEIGEKFEEFHYALKKRVWHKTLSN